MKTLIFKISVLAILQLTHGFWTAPGVVNNAIVFADVYNNSSSARADQFPLFQAITLSGDFTISFWVNLTDLTGQQGVALSSADGKNRVDLSGGKAKLFNGSAYVVEANTILNPNVWGNILIVRKGADVALFFNGVEENKGSWNGTFAFSSLGGSGNYFRQEFLGMLDDIRIYSRSLNTEEIENIFQSNFTQNSLSDGLDHHWPLDDVREFFNKEPVNDSFPFSSHWVGLLDTLPTRNGGSALRDLDNDGDLDFISGVVRENDVNNNNMFWWEYVGPDQWNKHLMGIGQSTVSGGEATDINGDGWVDFIAGKEWYENPKNERDSNWTLHKNVFGKYSEDISIGDVDGDGIMEIFFLHGPSVLYKVAPDPTQPAIVLGSWDDNLNKWEGASLGDIDGDGDMDIVRNERSWIKNVDGDGTNWELLPIQNLDLSGRVMTAMGDLDGDGDIDLAVVSHFAKEIAWLENLDGKGNSWVLNNLGSVLGRFHSISVSDFDNDGDLDIFGGENIGKNFIWSNDGKGNFVNYLVSVTARGHTARVGDVDCDGDLDILGQAWEGGNQVYHQNMLVERGGKPIFAVDRGPNESGFNIQEDCRELISKVKIIDNKIDQNTYFKFDLNSETNLQKSLTFNINIEGLYTLSILTPDGKIIKVFHKIGQSKFSEKHLFQVEGKGPWIAKLEFGRNIITQTITSP